MSSYRMAFCLILFTTIFTSSVFCQNVDTLNILHTSDPHVVYQLDEYNSVLADAHKMNDGKADSLGVFLKTMPKQLAADAVVITGDVIDFYEAETKLHSVRASQVEQFRTLYDLCPVPLLLTLGNHDIVYYSANQAAHSIIESQTCAGRARAAWIRNIPCFYDGTYYARIFQVGKTKYHFIFLDNGYSLHDGGRTIDKVQLDWLEEQLSTAGREPVILFAHIYFSVGDNNGDGISFKEKGPLDWPTEQQCSTGLLKLLNENRNIKAMIVGHGHSNIFEGIRFPNGHTIYQIETGAVTEGPLNWRLLQFVENGITVSRSGSRKAEIVIDVTEKEE